MSETNEERRARLLYAFRDYWIDGFPDSGINRALIEDAYEVAQLLGIHIDGWRPKREVRDLINKHFDKLKEAEMSEGKFKVGDRVRRRHGFPFPGTKEKEVVVTDVIFPTSHYDTKTLYLLNEVHGRWDESLIELAESVSSPIQSRTVKELVAGVYGRVALHFYGNVQTLDSTKDVEFVAIGLDRSHMDTATTKFDTNYQPMTAQDLRAAAETFLEIADYLEGK